MYASQLFNKAHSARKTPVGEVETTVHTSAQVTLGFVIRVLPIIPLCNISLITFYMTLGMKTGMILDDLTMNTDTDTD